MQGLPRSEPPPPRDPNSARRLLPPPTAIQCLRLASTPRLHPLDPATPPSPTNRPTTSLTRRAQLLPNPATHAPVQPHLRPPTLLTLAAPPQPPLSPQPSITTSHPPFNAAVLHLPLLVPTAHRPTPSDPPWTRPLSAGPTPTPPRTLALTTQHPHHLQQLTSSLRDSPPYGLKHDHSFLAA